MYVPNKSWLNPINPTYIIGSTNNEHGQKGNAKSSEKNILNINTQNTDEFIKEDDNESDNQNLLELLSELIKSIINFIINFFRNILQIKNNNI